jgi:hypothetical protein
MPLTAAQDRLSNINESIKDWLNTNVVIPYNAEAATTPWPNPLGITLEKPVDPQQKPILPLLVLSKTPITPQKSESTGMGDGIVNRFKTIRIYCFPGVDANSEPDDMLVEMLDKYITYAVETALYIPIYDYSTNPKTLAEMAEVTDARVVVPIGRPDPILNIERNRFDMILSFKYPVVTPNG